MGMLEILTTNKVQLRKKIDGTKRKVKENGRSVFLEKANPIHRYITVLTTRD
jgi:hypothetical protein